MFLPFSINKHILEYINQSYDMYPYNHSLPFEPYENLLEYMYITATTCSLQTLQLKVYQAVGTTYRRWSSTRRSLLQPKATPCAGLRTPPAPAVNHLKAAPHCDAARTQSLPAPRRPVRRRPEGRCPLPTPEAARPEPLRAHRSPVRRKYGVPPPATRGWGFGSGFWKMRASGLVFFGLLREKWTVNLGL